MNRFEALLRVIRIGNGIIAVLTVELYLWLTFEQWKPDQTALLCMVIVFCAVSGGNVLNDVQDIHIDRANKRTDRPLVTGDLNTVTARWLATALMLTAVTLALLINIETVLLTVLNLSLLLLYPRYLKRLPGIGNVTVAWLSSSIFILCSLAFDDMSNIIIVMMLVFFSHMIREIIKDMEDMEGDQLADHRTLPLRIGVAHSRLIATLNSALLLVVILTPYYFNASTIYLITALVAIVTPLGYANWILYNERGKTSFKKAALVIKLIMLIGLVFTGIFKNDIRLS